MSEPTGVTDADLAGTPGEVVQAVWARALGLDALDPDTGFFDLGASSAIVLSVVRTLRRRWPRLRIVDIFNNPTVAQLTEFLGDV